MSTPLIMLFLLANWVWVEDLRFMIIIMASTLSFKFLIVSPLILTLLSYCPHVVVCSTYRTENFIRCFTDHMNTSQLILSPWDPSFNATLLSAVHNDRFLRSASRPALIVTPTHESHVRASVVCGKKHGLRLRVRSGGHDFAGLSYSSLSPDERFVMVDLARLRSIEVDIEGRTAWVEAGATIGELYYEIAMRSNMLGFPAGLAPTIGVGGHVSGGGAGFLIRKYGLAADNVVDARIIDVSGQVLDRESMGEDLFWAIRGGGGASFGIILSYKINLVDVPPVVTVFKITKSMDRRTTKLISKWQHVASRAVDDLHLSVTIIPSQDSGNLLIIFQCLFLGNRSSLMPIMEDSFPELGLKLKDCEEMRWIDSILFYSPTNERLVKDLLDRSPKMHASFKSKIDFVKEPLSETDIGGILRWLIVLKGEASSWRLDLDPFGARMDQIPESATPYPHRKGNLYKIISIVAWTKQDESEVEKNVEWIHGFYEYVTPYVSKDPRCSYYNMKDLDLGWNKGEGKGTYKEARVWGLKYFKGNFKRLAMVKSKVDPHNYFWSEQSIPPIDGRLSVQF